MAKTLQEAFVEFNNTIKLDIENNRPLAEKRDLLIRELNNHLKKIKDEDDIKLTFVPKNQGSYAMGTGVYPLPRNDYDIDIMLLFDIDHKEHDAKFIKKIVFDALDKYPRDTDILKPCVRVQYHQNGEDKYHVDLAVYAKNESGTFLSIKPKYKTDDEIWQDSEPEELRKMIENYDPEPKVRAQFRRVIRYMKRWKDIKFNSNSNGKPTGIAITALALDGFQTTVEKEHDYISNKTTYTADDLEATIKFVKYIISQFSWFDNNISVKLPVSPKNDLFEKMTNSQKNTLKEKLEMLRDDLISAQNESDPHKSSKKLRQQKVFGEDFPEIPKEETGQKRSQAIIPSPDQA